MKNQRVFARLALVILLAFCTEINCCGRGEFVASYKREGHNIIEQCESCADGYYNDHSSHNFRHCFHCSGFDRYDSRKILLKNCTRFENIKIACVDNFFLVDDRDGGYCQACSNCLPNEILAKKCTNDGDTICCLKENTTTDIRCKELGYDRFDEYELKNRNDSKPDCSKPDAEGCSDSYDRHRKAKSENRTKNNAGGIISVNIVAIMSCIILQALVFILQYK